MISTILCAISNLAPAIALDKQPIAADLNLFEDKEKGYNIMLPKAWKIKKDPFVDIVAAPSEKVDGFNPMPNIKVVAKPIPDGQTLDTICDTAVRQWSSIWKVESDKKSEAGHLPMRKLILLQTLKLQAGSEKPATQQTKVLKGFAVGKNYYFIISCSSFIDNFDSNLVMFNKVLDSLTLTKP